MAKREPQLYHSDLHLPKTKRLWLTIAESEAFAALFPLVFALVVVSPIFFIGAWWAILICVAALFFALGWNMARRRWLRDGSIDRI